jgi:hypothetical protein
MRARNYDPSTGQLLTRDPIQALTQQPYQYAYDNPLNEVDPLGLWCWNPIDDAKQAAGDVAHGVSTAASAVGHWATTATSLPNSRFFTGIVNTANGGLKVGTGVVLVTVGTAADVTGIGAVLGVPVQAYGVYQTTTGGFRIYRGYERLDDAWHHPTVCKSPLHYAEDTGLDVAPGGGGIENLLGGLP